MRAAQEGYKLEVQQEKSGLDYRKNFPTMRHKEIFTRCLLGGCRRENKISPPLWGLFWSRGLNCAIWPSFHQPWEFTINFREELTFLVEVYSLQEIWLYDPLWVSSFRLQTRLHNHCAPHMRPRDVGNEDSSILCFTTGAQNTPLHLSLS